MTATPNARSHWPGLDGLRGIAALSVVLFHANVGLAANGFVGVDVFFVLSGFLITTILLSEVGRSGTVRLRRFYLRRFLRLYPALVCVCVLVGLAAVASGRVAEVWPGLAAALLYVSNWWIYTGGESPMLEHTWTLAIEEHFYLVWPLLLLALSAHRVLVKVGAGVVVGTLVVLLFVPWTRPLDGVRESYLRGFPIVWGSLLAVLHHKRLLRGGTNLLAAGVLSLALLMAILVLPWELPEGWLTGPLSITGALSILVVAATVAGRPSRTASALSWTPLRWSGTRSYGLYLYHLPILSVLTHQVTVGPHWLRMVAGIVLSLLVTEMSFRWVESPFLRLKDRARSLIPTPVSTTS